MESTQSSSNTNHLFPTPITVEFVVDDRAQGRLCSRYHVPQPNATQLVTTVDKDT